MVSLTVLLSSVLMLVFVRETGANLGSADNIANQIGDVLAQFMAKWFDKDAITKIYSTQSYDTLTGKKSVLSKENYSKIQIAMKFAKHLSLVFTTNRAGNT